MNNSVFLCCQCAELHQSLGENISNVKLLEDAQLTPDEITILSIGGNKRLESLLSEYNVPNNKIQKYNTRIVHYYRKLLSIEGSFNDQKDPNEDYQKLIATKPSIEDGSKLVETSGEDKDKDIDNGEPPAYSVHEGVKEDFNQITKAVGGVFGWLGNAIASTAEVIGIDKKIIETRDEFNEKLSQIKVNDNLIKAGNTVYEAMKSSTNYVTNKVSESKAFQSVTHSVDQSYITVKQTLSNIVKPLTYQENKEEDQQQQETKTIITIEPSPNDKNNNAPPIIEDQDNINYFDINSINH